MRDIRFVEVAPLIEGRVKSRIEDVRSGSVIIRSPFYKVICNIKRGRIWASVLEINNNYLGKTGVLARYARNA